VGVDKAASRKRLAMIDAVRTQLPELVNSLVALSESLMETVDIDPVVAEFMCDRALGGAKLGIALNGWSRRLPCDHEMCIFLTQMLWMEHNSDLAARVTPRALSRLLDAACSTTDDLQLPDELVAYCRRVREDLGYTHDIFEGLERRRGRPRKHRVS
jgi:hypothetical protein